MHDRIESPIAGSPAGGCLASSQTPLRIHLVGAGGAGVSGLARILLAGGHQLTASDRAESRFTRSLEDLGITLELGPSTAECLPAGTEIVVRSAAVPLDDPQLTEARRRRIPVTKYAELAARVLPAPRTLAVAGTHGKTTSTWMLYAALASLAESAGTGAPRPGALVGGWSRELGTNAVAPTPGGWVAVEACEYDRSFLNFAPFGGIITNVEGDHLDYYGSLAAVEHAFCRFADRVHPDGLLVVGRDVPAAITEAAPCEVWQLGREFQVELCGERRGRFSYRLRGPRWSTPELQLNVPGSFNVDNSALAIALSMGVIERAGHHAGQGSSGRHLVGAAAAAGMAVAGYGGAERRFEPWGTAGGVEVVHDYAHHPTEVRAVVEAARRALPGRALHILFQPHQHSRTARFLGDFVESLRGVDRVVVAPVYGARVHIDDHSAGSVELAARLVQAGGEAEAPESLGAATKSLVAGLSPGAAALILGAGDVDEIRDDLLSELAMRGARTRRPVV